MSISSADLQPAAAPAAESPPPTSRLTDVLLLLRFATAMAASLSLAALPLSSLFVVRAVQVHGVLLVPGEEIVRLTGLRTGDRLFAVPAAEVAARVMRHPRVARAAVRVSPSGAVLVRVVERVPFAAFPRGDRYLVLDRGGIVIGEGTGAAGLPIVTAAGYEPAWANVGDRLPSGGIEHALEALTVLPPGTAPPGTRLRVAAQGDLVLFTPDGIAVRLGALRGLDDRARLMREVLAAVRARGLAVESLDLRFSGSVVMRPAPGDAAGEERGR